MRQHEAMIMPKGDQSEGANVSDIQALTLRTQSLSHAVDFWNLLMIWGLGLAALAAVFVVIATRIVVTRTGQLTDAQNLLSDAKDRQAAADSKEKDKKIADALKQAGESNKAAGEANERAASANEIAERERLARLQLEARLADRALTPAQQAHIASILRAFGPRRKDILIVGNTPEISRITNAIAAALVQAGWTIGNTGSAMGGSAAGVLIATRLGVAQDVVAAADSLSSLLREAGILSDRIPQYNDDLPAALTGTWDTKNTAPIRMIVGTKP
jgi:hypothetical protein